MELPESHLTAAEIERLDAYIKQLTATIRKAWTPEEEASRRGVDLRANAKLFQHDSRVFNLNFAVQEVDTSDIVFMNDESA